MRIVLNGFSGYMWSYNKSQQFQNVLLIKYNEIIMPAYFHVLRKKEHCVVQKKTFFSKTQ